MKRPAAKIALRMVRAVPPDLGSALAAVASVAVLRRGLTSGDVARLRVEAYREAGLVSRRAERCSGVSLSVYDLREAVSVGDEAEGGRWAVVCDAHASLVQVETRAHALAIKPHDFCGFCTGDYDFTE